MIKIIKNGNILNSDCEAIVNPVNTQGIMGAGLALAFKQKYPEMFLAYQLECTKNKVSIGEILIYNLDKKYFPQKYIFNFPTKTRWNLESDYNYIRLGMGDLINKISIYKLKSIAIPALGCGLGGLDYNKVKMLILSDIFRLESKLTYYLKVEIYSPQ